MSIKEVLDNLSQHWDTAWEQERVGPANTKRAEELHPSSFPYCGYRNAMSLLEHGESETYAMGAMMSYYVNMGTTAHLVFQDFMGQLGKKHGVVGRMIGDWRCLDSSCGHIVEFSTYKRCPKCKGATIYEELGVRYRKRTEGHVDGLYKLLGKYYVIDYKGLALDTPIPTPKGWTTMGELSVGDTVFDENGKRCKVTHKSDIHKRKCYKVLFNDGSEVVCDDEHLWVTETGQNKYKKTGVVNTETIKQTLTCKRGQKQHRVRVAGALKLPVKDLPIHPYVLGAWLGDGSAHCGVISKPETELFDNIAGCGYDIGGNLEKRPGFCPQIEIVGLKEQLRELGVLKNKHIPDLYMRASYKQRLDLLRGIFDTDGSWNKPRSMAVMNTVSRDFAEQVQELAASLGQKAHLHPYIATGFGKKVQAYFVDFSPIGGVNPFLISRKADLVVPKTTARSTHRVIVDVVPIKAVKTQCIAVDSPSKTYLCTKAMIPTHNTSSVRAVDHFRRTRKGYPYSSNKFQIRSYAAYLEQQYGIEIEGWVLIYAARDNPKTHYAMCGGILDEKDRKWINRYVKVSDEMFDIVRNKVKTNTLDPDDIQSLCKYKLCDSQEFYDREVHDQYNPCPYVSKCFTRAEYFLKKQIKVHNED